MPVGTQGAVKSLSPDDVRAGRRPDRPRPTPTICCCGRATSSSRARRPASLHGLGRPDPHRLRRLPGLQPGQAAQDRRGRRRVPLARRRRACASSRPSGPWRSSARWASTWCIRSTSAWPIRPRTSETERSLALTLRWAQRSWPRTGPGRRPRPCSGSSRADPTPTCAPARWPRRWRWGSPATRSAAWPWASPSPMMRDAHRGGGRARCRRTSPATSWVSASREDLVESVARGVDMFDCVLPTRNARNGQAFTPDGPLTLKQARFTRDPAPLRGGLRVLRVPPLLPRLPAPPVHGRASCWSTGCSRCTTCTSSWD